VVEFNCFVMCGYFGNMYTCIYCVLCCLYCVFCIVSFMYIYSYMFCLYYCKGYCHRVTTQLQLIIIIIIMNSAVTIFRMSSTQSELCPLDVLWPFFFIRALEYDTMRVEGNRKGEV